MMKTPVMVAALFFIPAAALNKESSVATLLGNAEETVHLSKLAKLGSSLTRNVENSVNNYFAQPYGEYLRDALISWAIFIVISCLAGCCLYKKELVPKERLSNYASKEEFSHGHFNCLSDSETCMCTLLCPALRWADTVSMFGFMKFWNAFWLFALMTLANVFAHCSLLIGPFTAIGMVWIHQSMRKKVGAKFCSLGNCLPDCCMACFLPHWAISQEARAVRLAFQDGLVGPAAKVEPPVLVTEGSRVVTQEKLIFTEERPAGVYVAPPVIVSREP